MAEVALRLGRTDAALLVDMIGRTAADLPVHEPSDDPELLYRMRPGFDAVLNLDAALLRAEEAAIADAPRRVATNSLGFRDRERTIGKAPGVFRILALGGSNTYGAAVTQGHTWPAQLEQVLQERGRDRVEVWNLGVDGYKTRQKLRLAEIALDRWDADLLIFQLANTGPRLILDGMQDDWSSWLDPTALPIDGGVYRENLVAFPAPGSLGLAFARRSALMRTVLVATNRIWRARTVPAGDDPLPLVLRSDTFEGAAFERFVADARGRLPVLIFVPPAGGRPPWLDPMDLPLVDTRDAPLPDRPDIAFIHPGADVYRWYAERLADALEGGACLEPHPTGQLGCLGLDTTRRPPEGR